MKKEKSVLIVEDEAIAAKGLEAKLARLGYSITGITGTGEEAIRLALDKDPDVILMDIRLSDDIDGITASQEIHKQADIPVVYLTAYSDDQTLRAVQLDRPLGYLVKPVEDRQLKAAIEVALHTRRIEQQMQAEEDHFRLLYQEAPLPYQSLDPHGKIIEVNNAWLNEFGYSGEEVVGQDFAKILASDSLEIFRREFAKFQEIGEVRGVNLQLQRGNGETVSTVFYGKARYDDQGEFKNSQCIITTIDDQPLTAAALRTSQYKFRKFFEDNPLLCYQVSPEGIILDVNRAAARTLGYCKDELIGRSIKTIYAPESVPKVEEILQEWRETGNVVRRSLTIKTKAGEMRQVLLDASTIRDAEGNILNSISMQRDATELYRTKLELEEKEKWYRLLYKDAPVGIYRTTSGGEVLECNHRMAQITGYKSPEAVRQSIINLADQFYVHPEDRETFLSRLREGGEIFNFECKAKRAGGEIFWVRLDARISEWRDEEEFLIEGFAQDVTSRHRAERQSRHLNRVLQAIRRVNQLILRVQDQRELIHRACELLIDSHGYHSAWIALLNKSGQITDYAIEGCGEEFEHLARRMEQNTLPQCGKEVLKTEDLIIVRHPDQFCNECPLSEEKTSGRGLTYPLSFSDTQYGVLTVYVPENIEINESEEALVREVGDDLAYALANIEREQHRQAAEEALQSSEEQYRELFNSIRDAILVADSQRNIVQCNQAFTELFGYSLEELQGKKTKFIYGDKRDYFKLGAQLDQAVEENYFYQTVGYVKKSGETFPGETRVYGYHDSAGRFQGYIGLIRDVTEKRELERQLNQAQRLEAVGRLAGGIAHDFNNLVTVIKGYSQMVLNSMEESHPMYEQLSQIQEAGKKAGDLTKQLLAFSRNQEREPEIIDLNETLRELRMMLERVIEENITLQFELCGDSEEVYMDPVQFEQIIMNLVVNARDAMPEGGIISIRSNLRTIEPGRLPSLPDIPSGEYMEFIVSDTGIGMDETTLTQIFEPFFTTKETGKGTGLGLATVYGIVRQNNGYIHVSSEPGQGTVFTLYFPTIENDSGAVSFSETTEETLRGNETILVVEDDKYVRELISEILESYGYRVISAGNETGALGACEQLGEAIAVLITDIILPGSSGPDIAETVTARIPDIRVIFMSGYDQELIEHHGFNRDQMVLLRKPFDPEQLLKKIREVLDR